MSSSRLTDEDQAKVDRYLEQGVNQTSRRPFRMWALFGVIWLVLGGMMLVSYWIALRHGVI
ncbi:MAG: DUF3094 domain-containing protein [Cellvibrionaceae bacterium]|nr:DUF3094 domain-containing protein [Cellvibrionaceae bacterium]